jgi:cyclohexanone monooxygenase
VAIVGTGATSVQAVPYLAKYARRLYVLQRTPSNIDARSNPPTDPEWVASLKPGWQAERMANFHRGAQEAFHPGDPDLVCDIWTEISRNLAAELEAEGWPQLSPEEFVARRDMVDYQVMERMRRRVDATVKDKATAEAMKPWFRFMCKRPLSNNDYYPAFNQPNVKLIDVSATQGVEAMTEKGFIADGVEYEVDCMIFASGFEVTSDLERRRGGVEVVRAGDLDMLARDDVVLRHRDHVVAELFGALDHAGLVGAGDRRFPQMHRRLEPKHVRQGKGKLHLRRPPA